jgi:ligand-binding sensor domain-containing protein
VTPKKRILLRAVVSFLMLIAAAVLFLHWRVNRAIQQSAEEISAEQHLRVHVAPFFTVDSRFEWIAAPSDYVTAATFQGNLFLAGSTGMDQFDARGTFVKSFRVGRDLPSSRIVQLATGTLVDSKSPELIIATAREGVLAFDGEALRTIRPQSLEARRITSILPLATGQLLIGTETLGVLAYDGKSMSAFHRTLADVHVTVLAGELGELWVGTQDRGLLFYRAGQTTAFAAELPDKRVYAITVHADRAYAGTATGVAEFEGGRFSRTIAPGVFARSLAVRNDTLQVGTIDQGVVEIALGKARAILSRRFGTDISEVRAFVTAGEELHALTREGLHSRSEGWRLVLMPPQQPLADANISALHVDSSGKLWVGYFDRGLDIIPASGTPIHVEDQHVFCVNRIVAHPQGTVVATANGLAMFDAAGNLQQVLRKKDGLIADHVTDVAVTSGSGMVLATGAGLTIMDRNGARSLYAFHGLVNNHVYALGMSPDGRTTMAGTLGGISVLSGDVVRASFTTATSDLKHNWITALAPLAREWLVGTYGAGVLRMDEYGRFHAFDVASGEFEINPNALLVTPTHVLAGSLDRGMFVYNRRRERWTQVQEGLPSLNVTAFAVGNGYVYVGTDNGLVRVREGDLD